MAMGQIDQFMAAIRRLESGSYEGNYSALGPVVSSGMYAGERAQGAYQIMKSNWAPWAAEAGIPNADWRDPKAQDVVARHKFKQYYEQFGSWDLAAVAWFAGPGRAKKAKAQGLEALSGMKDDVGTSVPGYVSKIRQYMGANVEVTDSTTAMAQRRIENPDEEPMATFEEPEPELSGAQALGKQTLKMLSGLVKSQPGYGPTASTALNTMFKLED